MSTIKQKVTLTYYITHEDGDYDLQCAMKAVALNLSISDALQEIRSRLKYGEDVTEKEDQVLRNLQTILNEHYVEG